jgi:aromatic ring-cleaving dioxygenase
MSRRGGTLLEDFDTSPVRPSDRSSMKLRLVTRNEDRGILVSWLMLNNSELGF